MLTETHRQRAATIVKGVLGTIGLLAYAAGVALACLLVLSTIRF